MGVDPITEGAAAVIVKCSEKQAAHDAPLFFGRLSVLSDLTAILGGLDVFHCVRLLCMPRREIGKWNPPLCSNN